MCYHQAACSRGQLETGQCLNNFVMMKANKFFVFTVSHTGASMSSASSDTGMSPSSSSPPQNVLAVECR